MFYEETVHSLMLNCHSWRRILRGSPGSCYSECVQVVGVAYVDVVSRKFQLSQFVDSTNLVNLESVVVQLRAKECLTSTSSEGDARATNLHQLLDRSHVAITERKKGSAAWELRSVCESY